MISTFFKGAFLSLGLVMPLGPQNAFIFQRAAQSSQFKKIFPVLIIVILCDAGLILGGILGGSLLEPILRWQALISTIGALFLFYLSYGMWKSAKSAKWQEEPYLLSTGKQIVYTLSISLLNPHAILDTFLVIGTVSSSFLGLEKNLFTLGCILIDILWFFSLATVGFWLKKLKQADSIVRLISRISSILMFFIAIDLLMKTFK